MALPAHISVPISCQAMLISTLILSFAPVLIWSQPASHPSQASSLSTHSQASSHLPSPHAEPTNTSLCPSPTATAAPRVFCDTDNTYPTLLSLLRLYLAATPETQSSPSASETARVNSTFTTKPLSSSETGRSSEASGPIATPLAQYGPVTSSKPDKTSSSPGMKIGAGIGIGLGILVLIAVALAMLWFRHRQNHNKRSFAAEGLECEAKPSFEENSAKSPRVRSEVTSSQDLICLGDGRDISPETHTLPPIGPRLTALNTTIPRKNDFKSSSASKLITTSISSPGLLGDAHAAFKFLDQSAPVAKEARSPVSPEEGPLGYYSNVPPSPEETLPPKTSQELPSVELGPSSLATKNSRGFFLPILQHESEDAAKPFSIILNSPQSIASTVKPTGERAHLRDHPQPLRSNSSASRGTLADPPNHRVPNVGNYTPGSNSTSGGSTIVKDSSLDAKDDSAAVQNFSRKIGSLRARQVREVNGPPAAHSHLDTRL